MNITRIFADHHQFYIFDSSYDHFSDDRLSWQDKNKKQYGYLATDRAIYVSTVAALNDHRVRVFINENPTQEYERKFSNIIDITSGCLVISALSNSKEDDLSISLAPGKYQITICSNSIGKDLFSFDKEYNEDMDDQEYFMHDEFENYDIFIQNT